MVNREFISLSESEKDRKFRETLREKTAGRLSDSEIETIVKSVQLKKQYAVVVHTDVSAFQETLRRSDDNAGSGSKQMNAGTDRGCDLPCMSSVITWTGATQNGIRQLHIFIPPERAEKGMGRHDQQRVAKKDGL